MFSIDESIKNAINEIISPIIISKDEVRDFGFKECFMDNRPSTEQFTLEKRLKRLENAMVLLGTVIINNYYSKE